MPKITLNIGMTVRVYGTVNIDAENPEAAIRELQTSKDTSSFRLHGYGSDDMDVLNSSEIYIDSYVDSDDFTKVPVGVMVENDQAIDTKVAGCVDAVEHAG